MHVFLSSFPGVCADWLVWQTESTAVVDLPDSDVADELVDDDDDDDGDEVVGSMDI